MSWWFDDEQRLKVAKQFQQLRIAYLQRIWRSDKDLKAEGFHVDDADTERAIHFFASRMWMVPMIFSITAIIWPMV